VTAQDVMLMLKGKCEITFENAKHIACQANEEGFDRVDEEVGNSIASIINKVGIEKALAPQSDEDEGEVDNG